MSEVVKSPRPGRYLDQLTRLHCGPDLLRLKVFPNAKEVTESFAAFQAVLDFLTPEGWKMGDASIAAIAVGDGSTPCTGATFAFRTAWQCYSVDPRLGQSWLAKGRADRAVERLTCLRSRIEEIAPIDSDRAIVLAVHSHAPLEASISAVRAREVAVVAIPCCFPLTLPTEPDWSYRDKAIWSPANHVLIWMSAPQGDVREANP